jgi:IclR family transcriptional regulator, pca regulon regulatory protein
MGRVTRSNEHDFTVTAFEKLDRGSPKFIQSLSRGLALLEVMGREMRPLSLSEIARALGTNKVTASRFCYTLAELGFIARNEDKRYSLTPRVLTLGYAAVRSLPWYDIAKHYLEILSKRIRERAASMTVLEGRDILYVIRVRKQRDMPWDLQVGTKLPVHATSQGKVLMAFGPPEITESILKDLEFRVYTPKTTRSLPALRKQLSRIRKQRYCINDEEFIMGLRSIAAPILDSTGTAIAAINVEVLSKNYTVEEIERDLPPQILETAEQISSAIRNML